MKIVIQWKPDDRTNVVVTGNNADKVVAAAEKLMRFTNPATTYVSATTDMPNNPKK